MTETSREMARYDDRIRAMSQFYQLDFEKSIRQIEQQIEAAEARGSRPVPGEGIPPDVVVATVRG
jgi:hypothetical protein